MATAWVSFDVKRKISEDHFWVDTAPSPLLNTALDAAVRVGEGIKKKKSEVRATPHPTAGSTATTRLRPASLARYRAASARDSRAAASVSCAPATVTPMETVSVGRSPP